MSLIRAFEVDLFPYCSAVGNLICLDTIKAFQPLGIDDSTHPAKIESFAI